MFFIVVYQAAWANEMGEIEKKDLKNVSFAKIGEFENTLLSIF